MDNDQKRTAVTDDECVSDRISFSDKIIGSMLRQKELALVASRDAPCLLESYLEQPEDGSAVLWLWREDAVSEADQEASAVGLELQPIRGGFRLIDSDRLPVSKPSSMNDALRLAGLYTRHVDAEAMVIRAMSESLPPGKQLPWRRIISSGFRKKSFPKNATAKLEMLDGTVSGISVSEVDWKCRAHGMENGRYVDEAVVGFSYHWVWRLDAVDLEDDESVKNAA